LGIYIIEIKKLKNLNRRYIVPNATSQNLKPFCITLAILLAGILALSGCAGLLKTIHLYVPRISPEDIKGLLDNGEQILIVDVRSVNAFKAQHIAGAISVPLKEVESRLDEFPLDQEIVFYCT
jgi:hypothetical protein